MKMILPGRSIATGCQSSTSIARAIMGPPLEDAAREGGTRLTQSVHVDDVAQEATGSEHEVFEVLSRAGARFTSQLQQQGFAISPKSTITSTSSALSKRLVKFFKQRGVTLKVVQVGVHLGHAEASRPRFAFRA